MESHPLVVMGLSEYTLMILPFIRLMLPTIQTAGTAGAKTVGLTAPTGTQYSIVAVEMSRIHNDRHRHRLRAHA